MQPCYGCSGLDGSPGTDHFVSEEPPGASRQMQFTKAGSEAIEHDGEASTGAYLYSLPCGKGSCSSEGCSLTRPSTFGRLRDASHVSGTYIGRHADTRARVGREQPPTHASPTNSSRRLQDSTLSLPPPAPSSPRLMLPDLERAERIGEFWSYLQAARSPNSRSTARRTGRSERCSSGCCGRLSAKPLSRQETGCSLHPETDRSLGAEELRAHVAAPAISGVTTSAR